MREHYSPKEYALAMLLMQPAISLKRCARGVHMKCDELGSADPLGDEEGLEC